MAKTKPSLLDSFSDLPDMAERSTPAPVAEASPHKAKATKQEKSGKGRDGQKGLTFWLDPAFDDTLAELELKLRRAGDKKTRGELGAEALNLLYRKHGLPVVGGMMGQHPITAAFLAALPADFTGKDRRDAESLFRCLATSAHGEAQDYEEELIADLYELRSGYGCWLQEVRQAIETADLSGHPAPESFRAGLLAAYAMARLFLLEINILAQQRKPETNAAGYFTGWKVPC